MAKRRANQQHPSQKVPRTIKALDAILDAKDSPVDVKEIAYCFMHEIGGPQGFVQRILEEYDGSPIGSLARSRILDIMVKLFQIATPKEKFGELGELSDEDLINILKGQVGLTAPANHGIQWIDHSCI